MNKVETIQRLALSVKETYNQSLKPGSEKTVQKVLDQYDDLVDQLVELTGGEANAYYTDPMLTSDYTLITSATANTLTYNELAEKVGSMMFGE